MEFKTSEIVSVYKLLGKAKLTKMESSDKFKVIKAMREMKPVADEWDSFLNTVDEKLKKENHEEIIEKAMKWNKEGEKTTLTNEERIEINTYLVNFEKEKQACIHEELNKNVVLDFSKISGSAFEKLVESNDWEVNEIIAVEELIKE